MKNKHFTTDEIIRLSIEFEEWADNLQKEYNEKELLTFLEKKFNYDLSNEQYDMLIRNIKMTWYSPVNY